MPTDCINLQLTHGAEQLQKISAPCVNCKSIQSVGINLQFNKILQDFWLSEWNKSLDYILQTMKLPNVDEELILELLGIAHTNDTAASIPGMALQVVEFSNGVYKIRKIVA